MSTIKVYKNGAIHELTIDDFDKAISTLRMFTAHFYANDLFGMSSELTRALTIIDGVRTSVLQSAKPSGVTATVATAKNAVNVDASKLSPDDLLSRPSVVTFPGKGDVKP